MRDAPSLVESLLDDLHIAVRTGDLATLARRLPELEGLRGDLAGVTDAPGLHRIRMKAERLSPCLAGAAAGIRAALARLQDIRSARQGLSVYTRQGRMTLADKAAGDSKRF